MEANFYIELMKATGLTIDEIRFAERHMIASQKMSGDQPYNERKFKDSLIKIVEKMKVGLTFETIVELIWLKFPLIQQPSTNKSIGPGFYKTQIQLEGRHVIYRNKFDKTYNNET